MSEKERFVELDDSYFEEMCEMFGNIFSHEPWNNDWSDKNQLTEYMREVSGSFRALNYGLITDGRLSAVSIGCIRHWWEGTTYLIEEFFVSPELQGRGIGSRFLEMIERDAARRGICGIFLQTDSDKPAYRFYRKNGFGELTGHVSFYKKSGNKP